MEVIQEIRNGASFLRVGIRPDPWIQDRLAFLINVHTAASYEIHLLVVQVK